MKRQIRRSIFETNSSSTHSITMTTEDLYKKWINGEAYFDDGEIKESTPEIKEERTKGIKKILTDCFDLDPVPSELNESNYADFLDAFDISEDSLYSEMFYSIPITYEEYNQWLEHQYYENFEKSYNGIIAFGYYGQNY